MNRPLYTKYICKRCLRARDKHKHGLSVIKGKDYCNECAKIVFPKAYYGGDE